MDNILKNDKTVSPQPELKTRGSTFVSGSEKATADLVYLLFEKPESFDPEKTVKHIQGIIKNEYRIFYSELTSLIYKLDKEDGFERISRNLDNTFSYAGKNCDLKIKTFLCKIYDHIELARIQKAEYAHNYERISKDISELGDDVNVAKKEVGDIQKGLMTQLISILAIFTALAFIIFGGLNSLHSFHDVLKLLIEHGNSFSCQVWVASVIAILLWGASMWFVLKKFKSFVLDICQIKTKENKKNNY